MSTAKHDRQEAIQKATDLFWAKGFHATSMRNIQQAMDMRPGSIYASFGNKEGLFKETLQHYADSSKARLNACVEEASSPLKGLKLFIRDAVIGCREKAPSGMCMLVKTISELTGENADLLEQAKGLVKEMEHAFMEVLIQAQELGEIDANKAPDRLARSVQVQLMGLRAYVRANDGDEEIDALIDDAFAHLT